MINITRSQPAPACLAIEKTKANGKYNGEEVIKRLKKDFHNKCYICEDMPQSINVEHFKPRTRHPHLTFEWTNLFYVCAHCNNTKLAKPKYDDILDCTNPNHKVSQWIEYEVSLFPKSKPKFKAQTQDIETINTVALLDEIFNGIQTPIKQQECQNLRKRLIEEMNKFNKTLHDYDEYQNQTNPDQEDYQDCLRRIKRHLHKSSTFAAFKWWVILQNEDLKRDFKQYIDIN